MTYNRLIQGLRLAGIEVDRKILADLAVNDEAAFAAIVELARAAVAAEGTGGAAAGCLSQLPDTRQPGVAPFTRGRPGSSLPADCTAAGTGRPPGGSWPRARRPSGRR